MRNPFRKRWEVVYFSKFGVTVASPRLDHADLNKSNNRIINLRPTTQSQNTANTFGRGGAVGVKGAHLCRATGRYRAQIKKDYKIVHLGRFDTPEEAGAAYEKAAVALFGEFART